MKIKPFLPLYCSLLVACSAAPLLGPTTDPAQEPARLMRSAASEIDALLSYHQWLLALTPAELTKELAVLNAQPKSARLALKKAMLLALTHGSDDLTRAQTLIDGVVNAPEADAQAVKPLAKILAAGYAEIRRLSDQAERLNQQVKENQRRIEQLNQKLEALKAIELTLPARSNGAPAAPATPTTKGTP